MFRVRAGLAFALMCALLPAAPRPVVADVPVPLEYKAYDGWNAIRTPELSDDGRRLAYAPRPRWMNGVDYLHRGERNVHPLFGEPD